MKQYRPGVTTSHDEAASKNSFLLNDDEAFDMFVDQAMLGCVELSDEDDFLAVVSDAFVLRGPGKASPVSSSDRWRIANEAVHVARVLSNARPDAHPLAGSRGLEIEMKKVIPDVVEDSSALDAPTPNRLSPGQEKLLKKLGWSISDPKNLDRLEILLGRMRQAGITDPHSHLSLREACEKTGIAERTLRRYIAEGLLPTEKVKGPRGPEHRIFAPRLFSVFLERAAAFERTHSSPVEDMSREIAALCRAIVEQQSHADRRVDRLLDEMRNQSKLIDELRAEQHDARAQMHALQENMIKALMPPEKKSMLKRLFSWS